MSVVDQLKNLFASKRAESPGDTSDLSLGVPDASLDPMTATGAMKAGAGAAAGSPADDSVADPDSIAPPDAAEQAELIFVPLLGRRSVVTHQRVLFALLALALVVLGSVAVFAVRQADTVARQVAGTGQSLMQSQRLAKSVSQALVGSPQAFPDVKESAETLGKTVRGLQGGDEALLLQPVVSDMQEDVAKILPIMERAEKNAATVMGQQKILTQVGNALR